MAGHKASKCSKRTKLALVELNDRASGRRGLVIDGKHDFLLGKDLDVETETIVHGDALNAYISMASIVAKVERDRVMVKMAKKHPAYGFERHKGYGTELHRDMIKKYGPCKIHRHTFLKNII